MNDKYSLEKSLKLYEIYLREKLNDEECLERFLELKNAKHLGCYCLPKNKCHVEIILKVLEEYCNEKLPERCCLKVKYLRPEWDNLKEWTQTEGNIMCIRNGRVFITKDGKKEIFHYSKSEWSNPYKVK